MSHSAELTQQMAAGDALLSQRGLHGGNRGGEDVGLLQHLRGVRAIQRAEHGAVVQLHALVQLDHGELVSARLGAPVLVLQKSDARQAVNEVIKPAVSPTVATPLLRYSPPPSSPSGRCAPVPWPSSERPRG